MLCGAREGMVWAGGGRVKPGGAASEKQKCCAGACYLYSSGTVAERYGNCCYGKWSVPQLMNRANAERKSKRHGSVNPCRWCLLTVWEKSRVYQTVNLLYHTVMRYVCIVGFSPIFAHATAFCAKLEDSAVGYHNGMQSCCGVSMCLLFAGAMPRALRQA